MNDTDIPRCHLEMDSPLADWREYLSSLQDAELCRAYRAIRRYVLRTETGTADTWTAIGNEAAAIAASRFESVVAERDFLSGELRKAKAMQRVNVNYRHEARRAPRFVE